MIGILKANPLALKATAIGALLVVAAIGVQQVRIYWLKAELADQKAANASLVADKRILTDANESCAQSVTAQNAAIKLWKDDQLAREAAAAKRAAEAEAKAAKWEATATDLRSRPMPVPGNACASLETLIDDEIRGRK